MIQLGAQVGKSFDLRAEGWWLKPPVGSSQRLKNRHLLLHWIAFTIKDLEQGWLAQCQFKVTGWGVMFICGMVLQCPGTLRPGFSLD